MRTRKLANRAVSELGFGCMSLGANDGPPAAVTQSVEAIRAAHAKDVTFFDTAEVYGCYTNEELVGQALSPLRDQVAIASKFGFSIDGTRKLNSRPKHIEAVAEASLKRLKTDRADLFFSTGSTPPCRSRKPPAPSKSSLDSEKRELAVWLISTRILDAIDVALCAADLREIHEALSRTVVVGERLPKAHMEQIEANA